MLIYDSEIINMIPGKDEKPLEDCTYCKGWDDFEGMGIACVCAWDWMERAPRVFMMDNFSELAALVQHQADQGQKIIGYNNQHFDDPLLAANGIHVPAECSYDLLKEIWTAAGMPTEFCADTHKGYGLEAVAQANGVDITDKRHSSALAPKMYQEGKYGHVIDHCLTDVAMLVQLIETVVLRGGLIDPVTYRKLQVKSPLVY